MAEHIPSVLIVDDEEEIRGILSHILEKEGFKVITAPDGQQAMEEICFDTPDAVLMDVHMPGLNGMEILKKIKAIDDNLPVVLVTAYADTHQAVEAIKEGAYDYLAKPFDNNEVVRITRRALAEGNLRRNLKSINDSYKGNFSLIESNGTKRQDWPAGGRYSPGGKI